MRTELFDAWVGALEKPHIWRQGKCKLESPDGCFCALGVMLRVDRWTRDLKRVTRGPHSVVYTYQGTSMTSYLSWPYRMAQGVDEAFLDEIINMNDGGTPFVEIAKWLRERRDVIVR